MYFDTMLQEDQDPHRYNVPSYNGSSIIPEGAGVVSAVFIRNPDGSIPQSTFLVYPKYSFAGNQLNQIMYENNPFCESMCYPMLFPCGESGYHVNIQHAKTDLKKQNRTTAREYAAYRMMSRGLGDVPRLDGGFVYADLNCARKLFQHYIVDSFVKAENEDLRFYKKHTAELKVSKYTAVHAYLRKKADEKGAVPGQVFVVPTSHTVIHLFLSLFCLYYFIYYMNLISNYKGSKRYMKEAMEDAVATLVGLNELHPDLFITITTNPNCREIQENLRPGEKYTDRPDLVARVFKLKLEVALKHLEECFGKQKCRFAVVEYQKRGLCSMSFK
jgi:hypothetical protein